MNRGPKLGDKEGGSCHDDLGAMRSPSDEEDEGLHEAAKTLEKMDSQMMRIVLTQSLFSGLAVKDIIDCMRKQSKGAKKCSEVTPHREETHDEASGMSDSSGLSHEGKRKSQDERISSDSESNNTVSQMPSYIDDFATFLSSVNGHALTPPILNHGGTVKIYYQTCHAACPSARKDETPASRCTDENAVNDPAFPVSQSRSAALLDALNASQAACITKSPGTDTLVSATEISFIENGVLAILSGEHDRAKIVHGFLELTGRIRTKGLCRNRRADASMNKSSTDEIKQGPKKEFEAIADEKLHSPREGEAESPALTGQIGGQGGDIKQSDTKGTFDIDSGDAEPGGVGPDRASVALPVPLSEVATQDASKQRHSLGTKHKYMHFDSARVSRNTMGQLSVDMKEKAELDDIPFPPSPTQNTSKVLFMPPKGYKFPKSARLLPKAVRNSDSQEKPVSTEAKSKANQQKQAQLREGPARTMVELQGQNEALQELVKETTSKDGRVGGFLGSHNEDVAAGAFNAVASAIAETDNPTKGSVATNPQGFGIINSSPSTQPSGPLRRVEEGKKVQVSHTQNNAASLEVAKPGARGDTDGMSSSSSKSDKDRIARTAALDSIAKLAREAGPEAYQQQSEGNFSFLQGPTVENRSCRLCRKMFTDATNVRQEDGTAPCSFHPGKLENKDPSSNVPAFTCCGGPPVMVMPGVAAMNLVGPGCRMCYHQDKKTAWSLETFTMADPELFQDWTSSVSTSTEVPTKSSGEEIQGSEDPDCSRRPSQR